MAKAAITVGRWGLVVLWALLPLVVGPAFGHALGPTDATFRSAVSVGLWAIWAATLTAALVPRTVTLTAVRLAVPAAPFALAWAIVVGDDASVIDAVGATVTIAAAVVALAPATGWVFVNGSSYGAERRYPLRPPGPLVLGPIEVAWAATIAGLCAGPLMLANGSTLPGLLALIVGWPVAGLAIRALHALARRWVVFTQAGLVIVDPMTLADSVLAMRQSVVAVGPAPQGTDALDLTARSLGLALELRFAAPQAVSMAVPRGRSTPPETVETTRIMFTPTRPGALLREAAERRLPVG